MSERGDARGGASAKRGGVSRLTHVLLAVAACAIAAVPTSSAGGGASVSVRTFRFVDRTRTVTLPDGRRVDRTIVTIVRFPSRQGSYPLVVFAHGFDVTPATYAALLNAWAQAGYVVAAPVFPRTNANAPGGPDGADLPNQPADVSFVITRLLALNAQHHGALYGRIDARRIAVAGQSDGGVTALAVAFEPGVRDARVRAAIILSGAEPAGMDAFPTHGPPLLAMQGTGDPINAPSNTEAYYRLAPTPKFLVLLDGASHLPPYTTEEPQLHLVERVSLAFLDHYLKGAPLRRLVLAADDPGVATLDAQPGTHGSG